MECDNSHKKTRGLKWNDNDIKKMLRIAIELKINEMFDSHRMSASSIYKKLAEKLEVKDENQIKIKFEILRRKFSVDKIELTKSGAGRESSTIYDEDMAELWGRRNKFSVPQNHLVDVTKMRREETSTAELPNSPEAPDEISCTPLIEMLETEIQAQTSCKTTQPKDFDPYVCSLNSKFRKIAQEELREDDNIRGQALAQFREWISKHPHIRKCRTDSIFLLRFLRTKKFSVPSACEMLEKYLTIRELYPSWFRNLDIEDPPIAEIIDAGYLVPLLERDYAGRQLILSCAGRFDPYRFTAAQMARTHSLVSEALFDDEESQVAGYTYINDESGLSMGHISLWSFVDIRNILRCIMDSTPMRHKETHFINVPSYAFKVIEFVKSLLTEKLRKRIQLHKDLEDLKQTFDPKILPKEYGGVVPLNEMIAKLKEKLREKRAAILALDDMEIEVSKYAANFAGNDNVDIDPGVVGSFRKLEVD